MLDFALYPGLLKKVRRSGWVLRGIPDAESVSDHSYRMAVMALLCAPEGIDAAHAVSLCLVHDLAEAIVGDITPFDGVGPGEKRALELAAMEQIAQSLPRRESSQQLLDLFKEYNAASTPEAKFVKDLDKLEMLVQAREYEDANPQIDLSDFFSSTPLEKFKTSVGRRHRLMLGSSRDMQRRVKNNSQRLTPFLVAITTFASVALSIRLLPNSSVSHIPLHINSTTVFGSPSLSWSLLAAQALFVESALVN